VGLFDKARPAEAFSRLGPLSRDYPKSATVRFHLGLLLLWSGQVKEARRQLLTVLSDRPNHREGQRLLQVVAREMLQEVESSRGNKLTLPASPLRMSRTPAAIRGGPPTIGADTRSVLRDLLGMTEAEIDAEFAKGAAVIGQDLPREITGA